MFAAHHRLGNLTAIIDMNGQQAFGLTRDVVEISNMAQRWQAFGWQTSEVDGHAIEDISDVLSRPTAPDGPPRVVLANTVFGKGVWYMEQGVALAQSHLPTRPINWHYLPMSGEEYQIAMLGLEES